MRAVADLHCDLLSYLCHAEGRSPYDTPSRCSVAALRAGNVKLQTLAIFSETHARSTEEGEAQVRAYGKLLNGHPDLFAPLEWPLHADSPHVHLRFAFENASTFAKEDEPLGQALQRLEGIIARIGAPLYISLTWNMENRFGGGNATTKGLKSDGRSLLEWMHGKKIALDLSHTSDRLAEEALDYIEAHAYEIPVLASHSNFRSVTPVERNLPDTIAKEIIRKKGLIGLNFFLPFIHRTDPSVLLRHVEYALELGAEDALAFGADFFCDSDFPDLGQKYGLEAFYFPEHSDASKYPQILENLAASLRLSEEQLLKVAHRNLLAFMKREAC